MRRWPLAAAAFSVTLYAGFRLNECVGTDLVLALEPPTEALAYLDVLNSKRTVGVVLMLVLTLSSSVLAVFAAGRRRLAVQGLIFLLADQTWTIALHIPLVTRLHRLQAIAAESDWSWLRGRYIADDVARTLLLMAAAISFLALATQTRDEILASPSGQSVDPHGVHPID